MHQIWFADVRECLTPTFTGRLDTEVTRSRHPFERGLVEEDGIDAIERYLDPILGEHPTPRDHSLGRHDEFRRGPLGIPDAKGHEGREDREADNHVQPESQVAVNGGRDDEQATDDHHGEQSADRHHRPPMGVHVDDNFFVITQEVRRKSHSWRA